MHEEFFICPWCWQRISVLIDLNEKEMEWIEDCEICCRPILFIARGEERVLLSFYYERAQ